VSPEPPPAPVVQEVRPVATKAPSAVEPEPAEKAVTPAPSTGYSQARTLWFSPQVLQLLPAIGLVVVLLLTFFPWVKVLIDGEWDSFSAWSFGFSRHGNLALAFYVLLTVVAMLLAIASLLFALKVIPDVPALRPIQPWRSVIVGGLAAAAWLLLTVVFLVWLFTAHEPFMFWAVLAWLVHTVAAGAAFLQFWLEQRGSSKPIPRITLEW
jgi:hypothetical protein